MIHQFEVPETLKNMRLDQCLAQLPAEWSRSHARRLIDEGRVTLRGKKGKPSDHVRAGDLIIVEEDPPRPASVEAEDIPLDVIYEDSHLLVINKAIGIVIHPAAGNPAGTLVNALLHHCNDLSGIGGVERPGIVHRLDKDTSGLLVVAKSDRAHQALSLAFRWRKVSKTYLAICFGQPKPVKGVIDEPIDRHPKDRKMMTVQPSGRSSRTLYTTKESYDGATLVACRLVTGRTHQIRVHMAHIGHALIGDPLYSGRQWRNLQNVEKRYACRDFPRQALHSWRLGFTHPITEEEVEFEAPWPEDMRELRQKLLG